MGMLSAAVSGERQPTPRAARPGRSERALTAEAMAMSASSAGGRVGVDGAVRENELAGWDGRSLRGSASKRSWTAW